MEMHPYEPLNVDMAIPAYGQTGNSESDASPPTKQRVDDEGEKRCDILLKKIQMFKVSDLCSCLVSLTLSLDCINVSNAFH